MASASKQQSHPSSAVRPLKAPLLHPSVGFDANHNSGADAASSSSSALAPSSQDMALGGASHLTHPELLRRRSYRLRQLRRCYRDHYWALMEELKIQYREYYWKYGVSPFRHDHQHSAENNAECTDENNNNNNNGTADAKLGGFGSGPGVVNNNNRCLFVGCKFKAMALTRFCHLHILSDPKQTLYKPCAYVIKSAQAGPITCGKPILRSTVPSLCSVHFQKAQKHMTRTLKKAGLNVSSSSKLAPKFHVIAAEYVRQIQARRRMMLKANRSRIGEGTA